MGTYRTPHMLEKMFDMLDQGDELQSKRRTEGTWVEWIMKDMKSKKIILLLKAKKCPIGPNLSNVPLN